MTQSEEGYVASTGDDVVFTGFDGSASVIEFLLEISETYPQYEPYWREAFRWLDAVAEPEETTHGTGYRWVVALGDSAVNYLYANASFIGERYLMAWRRTGDADYLEHAMGAMYYLVDHADHGPQGVRWKGREGYAGMVIGLLVGDANICKFMLDLYLATGNDLARSYAVASAAYLMAVAIEEPTGFTWAEGILSGDHEPGWCRGAAGISDLFFDYYEAFGDAAYLTYATGALDWLGSMAENDEGGWRWPYFWGPDETWYATGEGVGASGIGRRMLRGFHVTGDSLYLDYARGAADWLMAVAEPTAGGGFKWVDNVTTDRRITSFCQGYAGISTLFTELWEETGNVLYADYAVGSGTWLDSIKVLDAGGYTLPFMDGAIKAWPSALASTSQALWRIGHTFGVSDEMQLARAAAAWLGSVRSPEYDGCYWPYRIRLPSAGATGVDWRSDLDGGEEACLTLSVHPQPLRDGAAFSLHVPDRLAGRPAKAVLYDVTGRRVRELLLGRASSGPNLFSWDRNDESGRAAAPGIYLIRLEVGEESVAEKIVVAP